MTAKRSLCLSRHFHGSKDEASYCNWLLARKQGREILDYKIQASMPLIIRGKLWKRWKIDFKVFEKDGTESYHESKGWNRSDDCFQLKRDAFLICYPDLKLYVNKQIYTGRPNRERLRWTMADVVRKNKKAALNRKNVRQQWAQIKKDVAL